jgi:hypothetical protein
VSLGRLYATACASQDLSYRPCRQAKLNRPSLLAAEPEVEQRFDRVAALVEGFETPFGLELLATVHWVATLEGASTPDEAASRVHAWNHRKKAFTPRQIQLAYEAPRGDAQAWLAKASSRTFS